MLVTSVMVSTMSTICSSSGRDLLTALIVIELAAVVVGMIVRCRDVESAMCSVTTDQEREFRSGDEVRWFVRQHID